MQPQLKEAFIAKGKSSIMVTITVTLSVNFYTAKPRNGTLDIETNEILQFYKKKKLPSLVFREKQFLEKGKKE